MQPFETYLPFYQDKEGTTLKPLGEAKSFRFPCIKNRDKHYRLLVVGETDMFYQWKSEPDGFWLYHTLSDSLDYHHTRKAQYSLNVSAKTPASHVWRAYKKLPWQETNQNVAFSLHDKFYTLGFWVKAESLTFQEGSYLRMCIEVYSKTESINVRSNQNEKTVYEIPFPMGSYDWKKIEKTIEIDAENTAYVGVWFEGTGYTGDVYIERPFMLDERDVNNLPEFTLPITGHSHLDWTAQYLNKKDVATFSISLNGQEIFNGDILERIHTRQDFSIDLPSELLANDNELTLRLLSNYHEPLPFTIYEIALIEQNGGKVSIIATPKIAPVNGSAYALIRTEEENCKIEVSYESNALDGKKEYSFREKGLHILPMQCLSPCQNASFLITCAGVSVKGTIESIVIKQEDDVTTGTGDMIYISQDLNDVEEYLSWYLSHDLGNLFTIRPTYRWGVARERNPKAWALVNRILNEAGIYYTHIWDGRELCGISANPSTSDLEGEYFLGHQQHERDSMVNGRGSQKFTFYEEQRLDMAHRAYSEKPEYTSVEHAPYFVVYEADGIYNTRSPYTERDYKKGKDYIVRRLKEIRRNDVRHSGPEAIFRYFVQAGYPFVSAETNYSSMEILLSYLRGTKKGYSLPQTGIHHALQWSMPIDSEWTYKRFALALKIAYMQDVNCINTEEGLWHVEQGYKSGHRFSTPCQNYIAIQQDFYNYVRSHTRRGNFVTPFALLAGINDIYEGKGYRHGLGWSELPVGDEIKSWELVKTFYPLGADDWLYVCTSDAPKPFGFFTGTPNGNIDVLPAESPLCSYTQYRQVAFIGYNTADKETFEKLEAFVRGGGKLLLTRAHQTITTDVAALNAGDLAFNETLPLSFTDGKPVFQKTTFNGVEIEVCINNVPCDDVLKNTDGQDIVCRYQVGKGEVVLFNVKAYPAHPAIKALYQSELLRSFENAVDTQDVWVEANEKVAFSVYEHETGKDVYLLAVDWYNETDEARTATLKIAGVSYPLALPYGTLIKCAVKGNLGVYCTDENGEILEITEHGFTAQGTGVRNFVILRDGTSKEIQVDFTKQTIQTITF